jgi:hypothetical protein
MSQEDLENLLRSTICSEDSPGLSDAVVGAFISTQTPTSREITDRVRAKFVARVLDAFHDTPVREIREKWPFGRWIEAVRESVRLTRADIGAAVSRSSDFIEKLENGDLPPWSFKPDEIADLVCLFRIHMNAIAQLVSYSAAVSQRRTIGHVSARSHSGRISEARGRSAKKALDLYLARNVEPSPASEDINRWMEELKKSIQRRNAAYLIT